MMYFSQIVECCAFTIAKTEIILHRFSECFNFDSIHTHPIRLGCGFHLMHLCSLFFFFNACKTIGGQRLISTVPVCVSAAIMDTIMEGKTSSAYSQLTARHPRKPPQRPWRDRAHLLLGLLSYTTGPPAQGSTACSRLEPPILVVNQENAPTDRHGHRAICWGQLPN